MSYYISHCINITILNCLRNVRKRFWAFFFICRTTDSDAIWSWNSLEEYSNMFILLLVLSILLIFSSMWMHRISRAIPSHTTVQYNQIECLKVLLSHPDVAANADNAAGETPLHYAVFYVIIEYVKLLVENINTNVWIKDIRNTTPLTIVEHTESSAEEEIAELLTEHCH